jgi:hypothetical protein
MLNATRLGQAVDAITEAAADLGMPAQIISSFRL